MENSLFFLLATDLSFFNILPENPIRTTTHEDRYEHASLDDLGR